MRLDALMNLCAACGSFRPYWYSLAPERDCAGYGCRSCGSLIGNTPAQIAHLMRIADPERLRAQRLAWVGALRGADSDVEHERRLRRQNNGHNPDRPERNRIYQAASEWRSAIADTVRENFLASIGAVPAPVELYALWIDVWRKGDERRVSLQDNDYARSHTAAAQRYSDLRSGDLWMPTCRFQFDEIPPLYGARGIRLLLTPALSANALPVRRPWSPRTLGHSEVYALIRNGSRLSAWRSNDDGSGLDTYRDVEQMRQNRHLMRGIRRQWCSASVDHLLMEAA